jgi:oligopeptidase B
MVARVKKDDSSVPVKVNGYWYYSRFEDGKDYAFRCRKKESLDAEEQIMLNGPEMAVGHSYFAIGGASVSPNNELLAYGLDTVSRRQYTVHFKNLSTGEMLEDKIENTTGGVTWANDNKTVFYTRKDEVTLRSHKIYRHVLGTPTSDDVLIFEEKDEEYSTFVYKTKSKRFLIIGSSHTLATEYKYLDANDPYGEFKILEPRELKHEYSVSHYGDSFYIVTNLNAKNFRLMKTSVDAPGRANWEEVIAHRDDVLLEGIEIFKDHLVIEERKNGLNEIRIKTWDGQEDYYMEFQDPAYTAYASANPEFDTSVLRYGYTSMVTPNSTYDFDMRSKKRTLLKQQEVLGGSFKVEDYSSERLFATATDGTQVPISLVYKKGFKPDGSAPLLLYAYGSYGSSMDAYFSSVRLSLLDRGFAYAIAHIRGGEEMGRHWYEDGKMLNKKNTFTDFIDCGDFLIKEGYTSKGHLYAMGGSAGGLLMGAVMNMRPELWNGIVAAVPFVDVVTTMLDETIPLTTGEYSEWGNPNEKKYYDYMKSYSPYDNVKPMAYPNTLITTGYWDSQVQYWEPAKWIARLRDNHQGDNMIVMYCNMDTGHGGASGRFERYKEIALEYAFILNLEGINE